MREAYTYRAKNVYSTQFELLFCALVCKREYHYAYTFLLNPQL